MATTSIHEVRDLARTINYICNKSKTLGGQLIATINCSKETVIDDFRLTNYAGQELHKSRKGKDAVVIYQSFSPDDPITPEEALKIGVDFANQFTNQEHEVIVATHIDQAHIHNHIVINMRNINDFKKMRIQKNTHLKIRAISDQLCMEHGLSVLAHGQSKTLNYNDYFNIISTTHRDEIKSLIDLAIPNAESIVDVIKAFELNGAEVKRGKHLAVKLPGQKRFIRLKSLGNLYTEKSIEERIKLEKGTPGDNYKNILIANSLVRHTNEDEVLIRIPFTRQIMHLPKSDITHKNNKAIFAKIFYDKTYYVDNQVKLGMNFSDHFSEIEEKQQFYLNEFRDILKSNNVDPNTFMLQRHTKKQFVESVKRLNRVIAIAEEHNISKIMKTSFKEKIDQINQEIKQINKRIETFKKERVELAGLFKDVLLLEKYQELLPGDFMTTSIETKLALAKENLRKLGYSAEIPTLKQIKQQLNCQKQELSKLEKEITGLKNRKIELNQLKQEIKELVTQPSGYKSKNRQRTQEIQQALDR